MKSYKEENLTACTEKENFICLVVLDLEIVIRQMKSNSSLEYDEIIMQMLKAGLQGLYKLMKKTKKNKHIP